MHQRRAPPHRHVPGSCGEQDRVRGEVPYLSPMRPSKFLARRGDVDRDLSVPEMGIECCRLRDGLHAFSDVVRKIWTPSTLIWTISI